MRSALLEYCFCYTKSLAFVNRASSSDAAMVIYMCAHDSEKVFAVAAIIIRNCIVYGRLNPHGHDIARGRCLIEGR